jgi:hypothetical protein
VGLHLTKYYYDNAFARCRQWVRVYSEEQGANGRVVLEDIINVLLTENKSDLNENFNYASEVLILTEEKIELAEITPLLHEGLHLADVDQLLEFYYFCDDLSTPEIFETFGDWLNFQVCSLIIKRLAHLGHLVSQIPSWEKYHSRVRKYFNESEIISIREWLTKCYGLNVEWIIDIFVFKFRNMMSSAYKANTGEKPDTIGNNNIYPLQDFALIYQFVERMLSGNDNWKWLTDSCETDSVKKKVEPEKNQIKSLKENGKNDDEIIKSVWNVTTISNIVENQNYQYDILKAFVAKIN